MLANLSIRAPDRIIEDFAALTAVTRDERFVTARHSLRSRSWSESEFYEAGMSLPSDVSKHVALRLLESVDPDVAFDMVSETWLRNRSQCRLRRPRRRPVPGGPG